MTHSLFVSNAKRATFRKVWAALLMLSINLTGGVGASLFTANVAYATTGTVFSNGFETGNFSAWTSADSQWSTVHNNSLNGNWHASVSGNTGSSDDVLKKAVTTSGYTNISLSYVYKIAGSLEGASHDDDASAADHVYVEWTANGTTWSTLQDYTNLSAGGSNIASFNLPSGANNNPNFAVRFRAHLNSNGDDFRLDDVVVSGTVVTYPLSVHKLGSGSGQIVSAPAGINCGSTCVASFDNPTLVALTPTADTGSTFSGWSGCDSVSGSICRVTMSNAKSVTATFSLNSYTLSVTKSGTGSGLVSSSPAGINCGATCSASYTHGAVITLTASPLAGSTFTGWSGAGCAGTGSCVVTLTAAASVNALFTLNSYSLTVAKAGTGAGVVTSSPAGINCGADCSEAYNHGTVVTLSAAPAAHSTFAGWSGSGCSGTGTCVVTMTAASTVTATFDVETVALSLSTIGQGSVTSSPAGISCGLGGSDCDENYAYGTSVTLTPTADTGWQFAGWSGACTGVGSCTVSMTAAQTVTATFTFIPQVCPVNTVGVWPVCTPIVPEVCPVGTVGVFPVCIPINLQVCGDGAIQVPETCDDGNTTNGDGCSSVCTVETPAPVCGNGTIESGEQCDDSNTTNGDGCSSTCTTEAPVPVCDPEVNLLQNAGFESPALSNGSWSIIPFTDAALKWLGAFVNPSNTDNLGLEIQNHVAGTPSEGAQFAELDGYHPTAIWQNIPTIAGKDYKLTFKYSPRPGTALGNNVLEVRKDGSLLGAQISRGNAGADNDWSTETRTFQGTGASTKIEFADVSAADDSLGTYLDDMRLSCVGDHVPTATIVATKVVCDSEADLPDWINSGRTIDANSANLWVNGDPEHEVAGHPNCHLASDWQFEWGPTSEGNPGDALVGPAGGNWHTSGMTDANGTVAISVPVSSTNDGSVWMREVLKDGYIPFNNDGSRYSAEMYCNGDGYNYDNLDFARGLGTDGAVTYCVAFNAPKATTPENTPEACTDQKDNDGDNLIDANDPDCKPSITVIKHVVNDNNGTKNASDFTLHVNLPTPPVFDDACPEGQHWDGEHCDNNDSALNTIIEWFTPKVAFANIAQLIAPATFSGDEEGTTVYFNNETDYNVTEDADGQYSTTYGENCSGHISLGQHVTCVVTNDDIQQGSGGGSSNFDYWGCTNPAASNFNPLANKDDGSCKLLGGNGGNNPPAGEVLGASTTEPELSLPKGCSPYLLTYMKQGRKNDNEDVKRLQTFLNETMSANLPVSGIFGSLTKKWVKKLQIQNHDAIIKPWLDAGYSAKELKEGTGVVYKTTKYYINKSKCSSLNDPLPSLSNDPGLTD